MDINALLEPIKLAILDILANPILLDIGLGAFLFFMATTGVKRGYWFALWNLFFSAVVLFILLTFFLNVATGLVSNLTGAYLVFQDFDMSRTMAMFGILLAVLLFGWIVSGFIYLIFTPIKGRNYSYRDLDSMVVIKVKSYGFTVGLLEGIAYVLLFNIVLGNISTYLPEIFPNRFISTFLETLHPSNSIILSLLNNLLWDYGSFFQIG
ncbi:MAG: hypothetical protein FJ352_01725 [Firmicutes bacterium]|nr:hypothetical protein [Bacillota bacterium]